MMEEAADDTNGDSTFEFVGVKDATGPPETADKQPGINNTGTGDKPPASAPPVVATTKQTTFQPTSPQTTTQAQIPPRPITSPFQLSQMPAYAVPPVPAVPNVASPAAAPGPQSFVSNFQPQPAYHPAPQQPTVAQQPPPQPYYTPHTNYEAYTGSGDQSSFSMSLPTDYEQQGMPHSSAGGASAAGVWGWFKGNDFLNKVAEKAKNSVDSMITTLDPGMKEFICNGGSVKMVRIIGHVRNFSVRKIGRRLGTTTVFPNEYIELPIGYKAPCKERAVSIGRNTPPSSPSSSPRGAIERENMASHLCACSWFDLNCLVLKDNGNNVHVHTFGQATPVPADIVAEIQDRTPADYPLRWCGLAVTVGEVAGPRLCVPQSEWRAVLGGVGDAQLIASAAYTLATLYRRSLHR
ncbi:unnamed protein product [Ixodes hexagonus]